LGRSFILKLAFKFLIFENSLREIIILADRHKLVEFLEKFICTDLTKSNSITLITLGGEGL
jgi:hypothetical protein